MIVNTQRKYSPKSLSEFIFPDQDSRDLMMAYASGEMDKPLLLHGGSGAGKSTLQKLLPDAIEGNTAVVNKILCSELESPKLIHKAYQLIQKSFNKSFIVNSQKYNYFIIEEFNLKNNKLNDALKLELDNSLGIDITILSTNRFDEVDKGIKSRCEVLELKPCTPEIFFDRAKSIFQAEQKEIDDDRLRTCLEVVYKLHADNRKYYSALDSIFRNMQQ
jgi:replication-associated recombination protein RarA